MAIQMQQLTNMVSNLAQMGKEHVKMAENGAFVQATSSLGGRVINWCKAAFSSEAAANKEIINKVLNNIKNTSGMGDKFASIARTDFAENLASGRPISGMKVAQILDRVVNLAKDEHANFKLNANSLLADLKADFVEKKGILFESVSAGLDRFKCPDGTADDVFMAKVEKNIVDEFTRLAIRNNANVTPEQVRETCMEAARMTSMYATKDNSTLIASSFCSIAKETDALPTRVNELKLEAGIKAEIPLASLEKIASKIKDKVIDKALADHTQTTPDIAKVEVDKVIKKFLDGIKVIENAPNITETEKTALVNSIIIDTDIFTKDMAEVCVKTLHSTCELMDMFNQRDIQPDVLKAGIDKMTSDFNLAITIPQDGGMRASNPDIGADQIMTMRSVIINTYMAMNDMGVIQQTPNISDKIYHLTESLKDNYKLTANFLEKTPELSLDKEQRVELLAKLNIEHARLNKSDSLMSHAMNVGGALTSFRYAASKSKDPGLSAQAQVVTNILILVNQYTASGTQAKNRALIETLELGRLTMDQAREFMPIGHGKFGTLLDEDKAMKTLTQGSIATFVAGKKDIANVPNVPLAADSPLEQKMEYFSAQFLQDLWRSGITLNGEYVPSIKSDDKVAMTHLLDKVIAFFPDIETASLTTCGLHQGLSADFFAVLGDDPNTSEGLNTYFTSAISDINDGMRLTITDNGAGKYSADISVSKQKAGDEGVIAMNMKASYELDVNTAEGTIASIATGFDYILS